MFAGDPLVSTIFPPLSTVLLLESAGILNAHRWVDPVALKLRIPVCSTREPATGILFNPPGSAGTTSISTPMISPSVQASRSASQVLS